MVAIFTGLGAGTERGSASVLGGVGLLGAASLGRNGERLAVNAANGNLLITQQDEFLVGLGLNSSIGRAYNSIEDVSDGDNNDHWRQSTTRAIHGLTGTLNATGSTVKRTSGDGSDVTYTWNGTAYVATDGSGAYDTLTNTSGVWTWTDGDTQFTEKYTGYGVYGLTGTVNTAGSTITRLKSDGTSSIYSWDTATSKYIVSSGTASTDNLTYASGVWSWSNSGSPVAQYYYSNGANWRITEFGDTKGNKLSFTYNGANLDKVTTQNGEYEQYSWDSSGKITAIVTHYGTGNTSTITRTQYFYTAAGKLSSVQVDLTPENTGDGAVANTTYTTSYSYYSDGRIWVISETDGSSVTVEYDGSGRVSKLTQAVTGSANRVSTFAYDTATQTTITDALNQKTVLTYDVKGNLTKIVSSAGQVQQFAYDPNNGNVTSVDKGNGEVVSYGYDSSGNRTSEQDALGNRIERTYFKGRVLTETRFVTPDPDGAGTQTANLPQISRYFYDPATLNLLYSVSAEGAVTAYGYDGNGNQTSVIEYAGAKFDFVTYPTPNASNVSDWIISNASKRSAARRTETDYDARGNVKAVRGYSKLLSSGQFDLASTKNETTYTYSQHGDLLTRLVSTGGRTKIESYTYDGLSRIKSTSDNDGVETSVLFEDANHTTTVTMVGGVTRVSVYDLAGELISSTESGADVASVMSTYKYDALGQLKLKKDALGNYNYFFYDSVGRKTGEVDGSGTLTEYRYNAQNDVTSTTRYATKLNYSQLVDSSGNLVTTATLDTVRPTANPTDDQWTFNIYDLAQRLVQTIDGTGATTVYAYDGLSQLVSTTQRAGKVSPTDIATLKALESGPPNLIGNWSTNGGSLIGGTLTQTATGTSASMWQYSPITTSGQTVTFTVTLQAGSASSAVIALYGPSSGWGNAGDATISLSGPGTATGYLGASFQISGLSANAPTVIQISRVYNAPDSQMQPAIWIGTGLSASAGNTLLVSAPVLTAQSAGATMPHIPSYLPGTDPNDRLSRMFYDMDGNVTGTLDADGYLTKIVYDAGGLKTQTIAYAAATTSSLRAGGTFAQLLASVGATSATSTNKYDALGQLKLKVGALGQYTYFFYDGAGRKTAEVDALGAVTEYRYDTQDDVTSTTRYATKLNYSQLVDSSGNPLTTMVDGSGNTVALTLDAVRPAASTDDQWTFNIYDLAQRLVQTIDGTGATTVYAYDSLSQLISTTHYAGTVSAANIATLKANETAPNLAPTDITLWTKNSASVSPTTVNGASFYQVTQSAVGAYSTVEFSSPVTGADQQVTFTVTLMGTGAGTSAVVALYGASTGWGANADSSYAIVSGSGTIAGYGGVNSGVTVSGLSTSVATVVRITRTIRSPETLLRPYIALGSPTVAGTTSAILLVSPTLIIQSAPPHAASYQPGTDTTNDRVTRMFYDLDGNVTGTLDADGYLTKIVYDTSGRKTQTIAYAAVTISTLRAGGTFAQLLASVGTATSATSTNKYDALGQLKLKVGALGQYTYFFYDGAGRKTAEVDALGAVTEYRYDGQGDITSTTRYATTLTYSQLVDSSGNPRTTMVDGSGNTVALTLDTVRPASNPNDEQLTYKYDALGQLKLIKDALGQYTYFFYDSAGRKTADIDGLGDITEYRYDAQGDVTSTTRYATKLTPAQLASLVDGNGNPTSVTLGSVRPAPNPSDDQWTFNIYDLDQRLVQTIDGTGATTVYAYDSLSQLVSTTQYAGKVSPTDIAALKASAGGAPNLIGNWSVNGGSFNAGAFAQTAAGTSAYLAQWVPVTAGQTVTFTVTLKAGTATSAVIDLWGESTAWGNGGDATISLSGPGTATAFIGASFQISGLDANIATTIQISRVFNAPDAQMAPQIWIGTGLTATTGSSIIVSAPVLTSQAPGGTTPHVPSYLPGTDPNDRLSRMFYDMDGNVTGTLDADGYLTKIVYDASGLKIQTIAYARAVGTTAGLRASGVFTDLLANVLSGGTLTTSTNKYDALGQLKLKVDGLGQYNYFFYDSVGRKTGEVDGSGTLTEYRYDGQGDVTSTTRYATRVSYGQLVDNSGNLIATATLDTVRPTTNPNENQWTFNIYDLDQRLVQTIDGMGSTTVYTYDSLSQLVSTTHYAGAVSATDIATLKTSAGGAPNLIGSWSVYGGSFSGGTLTQTATGTSAYLYQYAPVTAGQTATFTITLQGTSSATSAVIDLWGVNTGWGNAGEATISLAGPGTATAHLGASFQISGLSTTAPTTIQISRVFNGPDTQMVPQIWIGTGLSASAGNTLLVSAPVLTAQSAGGAAPHVPSYLPATNGLDRVSRMFYDKDGNVIGTLDAEGDLTQFFYDAAGHKVHTIAYAKQADASPPSLRATGTFADLLANVGANPTTGASSNPKDIHHWMVYDARGLLAAEIDGEGDLTRYYYTSQGDLAQQVSGQQVDPAAYMTTPPTIATLPGAGSAILDTVDYTYNAFGQVKTQVRKLLVTASTTVSTTTSYTYDQVGNLVSTTTQSDSSDPHVFNQRYDALGRLTGALNAEGNAKLTAGMNQTDIDAVYAAWGITYTYDADSRLIATSEGRGTGSSPARTLNYYNADGTLAYVIKPLGEVTGYSYNGLGQRTDTTLYAKRIDAAAMTGGAASSISGTNAILNLPTSGADSKVHVDYNVDGTIKDSIDTLNLTTNYYYDAFGDLTSETDPFDSTVSPTIETKKTYDRRGLLKTSIIDPTGKAISTGYEYDAFGRVVTLTDPASQPTIKTYDRAGRLKTSKDALNNITTYSYDGRGNVAAVQDALNNVTRYVYDNAERLIYTIDALGGVIQNSYDNEGRVILTQAYAKPLSSTNLASLITLGTAAKVSDIASYVVATPASDELTHSVYDRDGKLRYSFDAGNFVTQFDYDVTGNAIRSIAYKAPLTPTAYTVDAISTALGTPPSDAQITRNVYNTDHQRTYAIDAAGYVTAYSYDAYGNVTKQLQAFTNYVTVMADTTGNPTDAAMANFVAGYPNTTYDRISRAIYDQDGRLRFDVDAEKYVTQYTYNEGGSVRSTTRYGDRFDGTTTGGVTYVAFADNTTLDLAKTYVAVTPSPDKPAAKTEYLYDSAGRLVETVDPTNVRTVLTLNQLGQATTTVFAPGTSDETITKQSYDALGRLTSTTRAFGQSEVTTTSYKYDALGRVTGKLEGNGSVVLTALVSPSPTDIDNVYTAYGTTYTYDANGNVLTTSVALDSGVPNAVTTNTYDAFGNVQTVTDPRLNIGYFYYNTLNQLTLQVDPEGYATGTTYTFAGETESVTRYVTALVSGTYSAGVRPTMAPPGAADETTTFGYDLLNRLSSTTDAANCTERYGLDAFGNRLSITNKLGTGAAYTTNYTYDLRGLMLTETLPIQSIAANGTINANSVTNTYTYDSRGNRLKMVEAQGLPEQRTTRYEYDALDRLTKQTGDVVATLNQGTVAPVTRYQYDRQGNLLLTTDPNGARTFSYYDHLNRKTLEINAVGTASAWTYDANSNVVQQKIYGTAQTVPATTDGTKPPITNSTVFRQTDYIYDRNNRLKSTSTPSALTGKWNGSTYVTTLATSANPLVTGQTAYDASGNIVQTTDGNGVSAYTYYDKAGRKVGQVDGAGYLTAYVLDQDGNVLTETRYATAVTGASTSSTLTSLINLAGSITNARITQFAYDKMGRRLTEKRLNVASAIIDVNGGMTTTTADSLITYTYNGLGEVTSKTEAAVDVTSGARDVTNYTYDAAGRLITTLGAKMTDSAGLPIRLKTNNSYDGLNNVTRTQVGANTVSNWVDRINTYAYGADGRLMATTNAGVNAAETKLTTYFVYDLAGHLVRQDQIRNTSDAASDTVDFRTTFSYDALGRATSQQSSYLSATAAAVYDYSKNLIVNGSFEDLGAVDHTAEWGSITSSLPGWTKANTGLLNITTGLGYGIGPTDGIYGLDSDGEGGSGSNIDISQTINGLTAGQVLQLGLDHMGTASFFPNSVEVSWNGVVIGTLSGTGAVMKTDWLNVTAIAGGNTLRLRETGVINAYGMVLDNIRLFAALPSSASSGWVNGDSQGVTYDTYGEIVAQNINGTLTTQAVYDSTGHVVQSNSGDGTWKTYINDGNGNATLTIQTIGTTDLAPLTVDQALALATNNGANTAGAAAGNGVVVTIGVFDGRNQQTEVRMPLRDSVMDANNVVTSYTVGQNLIKTTQAYNAFGEVTSQTDARGNITSFVYNSMGRVTAQISPQVQITGEDGQPTSSVQTRYDANSAWNTTPTQYSYFDASGRLVATRDANGNLTTRILLAGSGYGGADPLTLVEIHPDGGKIKTGYDVFGDAVTITDALNKVTTNTFDQVGNLIEVDHPIRAYNSDGSAGDGLQLKDYYSYDGQGERVGHSNNVLTDSGGAPAIETTSYDAEGRVVSTTDFGGHTIRYMYQWNAAQATAGLATYGGWTKTVVYLDSSKISKDSTDSFGREVAKTDLGGNVYSYTFNKAGQLVTETSVTATGVAAENISYSYDNTGKISKITDNSARSSIYYSASVESKFSYDRSGNRVTTNYTSTSNYQNSYYGYYYSIPITTVLENSTATYDAMNRVMRILDPGDSGNSRPSFDQTRTYDANGNVRSNITTHQGIDGYQNLTAATTDTYWFAYDSMNQFTVTEGTLSGPPGAAGTHVIAGTTGTAITYYATGQRKTATSYSGYQYSQDTYVYTADGYLSTVGIGTSSNGGATFTSPVTRSVDTRDALGRVTGHNEYNASGTVVVYSRTAIYNNLGQVTSDQVAAVQGSDTNVGSTTYLYSQAGVSGTYVNGNILSQSTINKKNGTYKSTVTTANSYSWYDNAQQREITAATTGDQAGNTTSIFSYDGNGHVAQVTRTGQNANTISYTTTSSGQIMARKQQQSAGGASPAEYYFYLNNVMVGEISNNGSENPNYAASITQHTTAPPSPSGPFANGATTGSSYANFDLSYQAMNPTAMAENGSGQAYTVIQGDTLSTVAQNIYGDSALWYLIAEANGLNANSPLTAGQLLIVPSKIANSHNNASTFRPYNPNAALGDIQPGAPVPPKKGCGILGMILLAVIAIAVTVVTAGAAAAAAAPSITGIFGAGGGISAIFGGTLAGAIGGGLGGTLGVIAIGAGSAAIGSIVSQGIGVATGLQDHFSWKAVGMAALGGGVTAGIGGGGIFGTKSFAAGLGIGSKVLQAGVNGAVGSAITQGLGVATRLQHGFDWVGVAAAGIGAAAGEIAFPKLPSLSGGGNTIGNYAAHFAQNSVSAIANAATRSLITGSDFGDNIVGALPGVIAQTIGDLISNGVSSADKKKPAGKVIDPGEHQQSTDTSNTSGLSPESVDAARLDKVRAIVEASAQRQSLKIVRRGIVQQPLIPSGNFVDTAPDIDYQPGVADRGGQNITYNGDITGKILYGAWGLFSDGTVNEFYQVNDGPADRYTGGNQNLDNGLSIVYGPRQSDVVVTGTRIKEQPQPESQEERDMDEAAAEMSRGDLYSNHYAPDDPSVFMPATPSQRLEHAATTISRANDNVYDYYKTLSKLSDRVTDRVPVLRGVVFEADAAMAFGHTVVKAGTSTMHAVADPVGAIKGLGTGLAHGVDDLLNLNNTPAYVELGKLANYVSHLDRHQVAAGYGTGAAYVVMALNPAGEVADGVEASTLIARDIRALNEFGDESAMAGAARSSTPSIEVGSAPVRNDALMELAQAASPRGRAVAAMSDARIATSGSGISEVDSLVTSSISRVEDAQAAIDIQRVASGGSVIDLGVDASPLASSRIAGFEEPVGRIQALAPERGLGGGIYDLGISSPRYTLNAPTNTWAGNTAGTVRAFAANRVGADLIVSRPKILSNANLPPDELAYLQKQFSRKALSIQRAAKRGDLTFSPGTDSVRIKSLQEAYRADVIARYKSMYGKPLDLSRFNADHPVDLIVGGAADQRLRLLNDTINQSVGSSLRQAAKRANLIPGAPINSVTFR